jgi:hypothetical protein
MFNRGQQSHIISTFKQAEALLCRIEEHLHGTDIRTLLHGRVTLSEEQQALVRSQVGNTREEMCRSLHRLALDIPPPPANTAHAIMTTLLFVKETFEGLDAKSLTACGDGEEKDAAEADAVSRSLLHAAESFLRRIADW